MHVRVGQVGSSFLAPLAMVTSTTVAGRSRPIVPGRGADTCSRGGGWSHPRSPLTARGTPRTRLLCSMGYTSSQNSTSLAGAASSMRLNSPVLSSWMLQCSLGVMTIWRPKNHWVLYGFSGIGPGRVIPGVLQLGTQPRIGWGTSASWAAAVAEGAAPPAVSADGGGCWDPPELHAAPSSPTASINTTIRFISSSLIRSGAGSVAPIQPVALGRAVGVLSLAGAQIAGSVTDHDLAVQSRRKGGQLAVQDALRIPSYRIVVMIPSASSSGPRPSGDHAGLKAASGVWPVVVRAHNDAVGATARAAPGF